MGKLILTLVESLKLVVHHYNSQMCVLLCPLHYMVFLFVCYLQMNQKRLIRNGKTALEGMYIADIKHCTEMIYCHSVCPFFSCRLHHQWSRGIRGGDHDRFADSRGLERPGGLLPPLSEKDARAAQRNDRRSRSPERENLHHRSSKRRHDSDGNAARRREYVKEERKVHF